MIPIVKPPMPMHVANENLIVHTNLGLDVTETCAVSTNVTNSAPSVVSCDMQVPFEEREHIIFEKEKVPFEEREQVAFEIGRAHV